MNQLNQEQIHQHVTILGWLHIIMHAFFLVIGGFVYILLTGIGVTSGDPEAVAILRVAGAAIGIFLGVLGLPGIIAGYGLLMRRTWGRILGIVIGILNIVNVPVGTIVGAYTIWILLQDETADYFTNHEIIPKVGNVHP